MKLISDIINELMDYSHPISGPLLKTKVLAARIGNIELLDWVNSEINGYEESTEPPSYRQTSGIAMGSFANGAKLYSNSQMPLGTLSDKERKILTSIIIRDSIEAVDKMKDQSGLKISINDEMKRYIEYNVRNLGNRFFEILVIYLDIPSAFLSNILSSVRSKLLDFMLAIESAFGQETELEDLRKKNTIITQIMNTTINNNGDANVINTGSHSTINTNTSIYKGDIDVLRQSLKKHNISDVDIEELLLVVDEEPSKEIGHYSANVTNWIKKMVNKAIDGTWQIGIGAAGSVIADALAIHYGWK